MKILRIGLTHGDINGIGYELLLKVLSSPEILDICTPVIFGIPEIAFETLQTLQMEEQPAFNIVPTADQVLDGHINLVDILHDKAENEIPHLHFGEQTEEALLAEAESLTQALRAWTDHHIDALVTLPGHLDNDADSHALCDLIHKALGGEKTTFDWILSGAQRWLQLHPIETNTELGMGLASERLIADITDIHNSIRTDFSELRPRIALVSSLPKTRDDVRSLQEQGIEVFGPQDPKQFAADPSRSSHYDAVLFLEADQVHHATIKAADATTLIGYVSNIPLVLTYPLLPVSYDKAGKGVCDATPLREAIYAAIDIYRSRSTYRHATRNVLAKYWNPRGRDDFKLDLTKEE